MNDSGFASKNNVSSTRKSPSDWARHWFTQLARFHKVHDPARWRFSDDDVIQFLCAKKKAGMPTWKRLLIVKGLITYRNQFLRSHEPRLEHIRAKLQQKVIREREEEVKPDIEEVVGKLNPRDPDVIQAFQRALRVHGRAKNTETAYLKWARRFMKVRGLKNLSDFQTIGSADVEAFLTDLAVDGGVAASTQEQAFYALLFLFQNVLKKEIRGIHALRSDKPRLVPTVFSKSEVPRLLTEMKGVYRLMAELMYGGGLRIGECLRLRVMDFDFDQMLVRVCCSKGNKSRFVPLPEYLVPKLKSLMRWREGVHQQDLMEGRASVWLPYGLGFVDQSKTRWHPCAASR